MKLHTSLATLVLLSVCVRAPAAVSADADAATARILAEIAAPTFPDREVSIVDYGAKAGVTHLNTDAIQAAIDACSEAGGGVVRVPSGRWLTGPIELRSRINLHLEDGATLVFTTDKERYFGVRSAVATGEWAQHGLGPAELQKAVLPVPQITAVDCEDIAITGEGTLDGQGAGWWPLNRRWWARFGKDAPDAAAVEERAWRGLDRSTSPQRPRMFQPIRCRNVLLEGITAVDGPFWMINPVGCENVVMRNLTIRAAWTGPDPDTPNTDGINPESCRNVLIENCDIDTGDDSIAIKSGRDELGRRRGMPSENIVIRGVTCNRIAIGSEMSGGVRNVVIRDCDIRGSNSVLHIKSRRARGGVVENVWLDDVRVESFFEVLIKLDLEYWTHMDPAPPEPLSERTPHFRNFSFSNVRGGRGTGDAMLVYINGLTESVIENVTFRNIDIPAPRGIVCNNARGLRFENMKLRASEGPTISIRNCRDVEFRQFAVETDGATRIEVAGGYSDDIRFDAASRLPRAKVVLADGAKPDAIKLPQ